MGILVVQRSFVVSLVGLAAVSLGGCVEEEGVLLEASLTSPSLTVSASPLTTELTGSFDIELSLGERASDPTTVKLGTFSLERDGEVLLNPLDFATDPTFPLEVGVGTSKHVDATLNDSEGEPELATTLCAAELTIVGTLTDTLGDDHPLTLKSAPFRPTCPAE